MRFLSLFAALAAAALGAACSSQQSYAVGQTWQRNECNKIHDQQDRQRCMASTNTSFEDYQKQSDAAKGTK